MKILDQHLTISHEVARARYFRMHINLSGHSHAVPAVPAEPPKNAWPHPGYVKLVSGGEAFRYPKVGRCIYCGEIEFTPGSGLPLSEEHIIAEGLGARLILPEASCRCCARKTTQIEGIVLRELLWTPRRHLKIRGKRRKRTERVYPITTMAEGREVTVELPIRDYPAMLLLPTFNPPGVFIGRPTGYGGICGAWGLQLNTFDRVGKHGISEFASPAIDTVRFCQLLAKTAHGFAISQLGLGSFTPLLTDFIRRTFKRDEQYPECYYLIGGDPGDYAADDTMHIIGGRFVPKDGRVFLVIEMRLFANLGAPVFVATVGEMVTVEQKAKYRALTEAHERTLDKTPSKLP